MTHQAMDRHYRHVLDQPVPMLGDISPREAATTKKGRKKLVAWPKFIENAAAKQETDTLMAGYDMSWIWSDLGIADLRRSRVA